MRLVKPLPVCGVERGWGVELGFLVIFGGSVQCAL